MSYSVYFPFFHPKFPPQNITHFRLETVSTVSVLMSHAVNFRKDAFRLPRCNSINIEKFSTSKNCFLAMVKCKALKSCSLMKVRGNVVSKKLKAPSRRWWCHISQNPVAVLVYHSLANKDRKYVFQLLFSFHLHLRLLNPAGFFLISMLPKLTNSKS